MESTPDFVVIREPAQHRDGRVGSSAGRDRASTLFTTAEHGWTSIVSLSVPASCRSVGKSVGLAPVSVPRLEPTHAVPVLRRSLITTNWA